MDSMDIVARLKRCLATRKGGDRTTAGDELRLWDDLAAAIHEVEYLRSIAGAVIPDHSFRELVDNGAVSRNPKPPRELQIGVGDDGVE